MRRGLNQMALTLMQNRTKADGASSRAKEKICKKCGISQPADEYWHALTSPDGLQAYCKACLRRYRGQQELKRIETTCTKCGVVFMRGKRESAKCPKCKWGGCGKCNQVVGCICDLL